MMVLFLQILNWLWLSLYEGFTFGSTFNQIFKNSKNMVVVMALATVTFWGNGNNSYGVPNTLYTYLISVSVNQVLGNRDKIVKIVALSEATPKPSKELPFIVKNSDDKRAIFEAFNILEGMESLKGLKNHKSLVEVEKQMSMAGAFKDYY